jgi:hypothetical protein
MIMATCFAVLRKDVFGRPGGDCGRDVSTLLSLDSAVEELSTPPVGLGELTSIDLATM